MQATEAGTLILATLVVILWPVLFFASIVHFIKKIGESLKPKLKQGQQWKENNNPFNYADCATILDVQGEWVEYEVWNRRSVSVPDQKSAKISTFRLWYPVFVEEESDDSTN